MKRLKLASTSANQVHELLRHGSGFGSIKSLLISNADDTSGADFNFSLFIQTPSLEGKAAETFYILRHTVLPSGAAILLDDPGVISFDNEKYGLYLSMAASGAQFDVTIR